MNVNPTSIVQWQTLLCRLLTIWMLALPSFADPVIVDDIEYRVAVLAYRGDVKALDRWKSTMQYLSEALTTETERVVFKTLPMNLDQLDEAVINDDVDFVITNSGQFTRVGSKYGLSWLATLESRRHLAKDQVIGSALVVRHDSPFHQIEDLKNQTLGAVSPLAFGGFQIYWGELAQKNIKPERFFSELKFSSFPVDALVYWVRDRQVDAAILPACLLESMAKEGLIKFADYRVLDRRQSYGYECLHSSQLYPNWSFSKSEHTHNDVAERVAKALLAMPHDSAAAVSAHSRGWMTPVSSNNVHELYQLLDIHPWQREWPVALQKWLLQHWQWSALFALFMITGLLHHLWVQFLVNRRTGELKQANERAMQQQLQLEHAQRIAILGELSSNIAHELGQPLAAISNYADGGVVRLQAKHCQTESGQPEAPPEFNPEALLSLLQKIYAEAQRGGRIIQNIRSFAQKRDVIQSNVELVSLTQTTLELLDYELRKHRVQIELETQLARIFIAADQIELQQVFVNLIRNAIDACTESSTLPRITILIAQVEHNTFWTITDNGPGFTQTSIEQAFQNFSSTRHKGLGLGLSICRRIMLMNNGTIRAENLPTGGAKITCRFMTMPQEVDHEAAATRSDTCLYT